MTVDDVFAIVALHDVWGALLDEMALCACPGAAGEGVCARCACLATIAEACRLWAAQCWEDPHA